MRTVLVQTLSRVVRIINDAPQTQSVLTEYGDLLLLPSLSVTQAPACYGAECSLGPCPSRCADDSSSLKTKGPDSGPDFLICATLLDSGRR